MSFVKGFVFLALYDISIKHGFCGSDRNPRLNDSGREPVSKV
jgi:hypothetical protein